jgi:hypothetical protein
MTQPQPIQSESASAISMLDALIRDAHGAVKQYRVRDAVVALINAVECLAAKREPESSHLSDLLDKVAGLEKENHALRFELGEVMGERDTAVNAQMAAASEALSLSQLVAEWRPVVESAKRYVHCAKSGTHTEAQRCGRRDCLVAAVTDFGHPSVVPVEVAAGWEVNVIEARVKKHMDENPLPKAAFDAYTQAEPQPAPTSTASVEMNKMQHCLAHGGYGYSASCVVCFPPKAEPRSAPSEGERWVPPADRAPRMPLTLDGLDIYEWKRLADEWKRLADRGTNERDAARDERNTIGFQLQTALRDQHSTIDDMIDAVAGLYRERDEAVARAELAEVQRDAFAAKVVALEKTDAFAAMKARQFAEAERNKAWAAETKATARAASAESALANAEASLRIERKATEAAEKERDAARLELAAVGGDAGELMARRRLDQWRREGCTTRDVYPRPRGTVCAMESGRVLVEAGTHAGLAYLLGLVDPPKVAKGDG